MCQTMDGKSVVTRQEEEEEEEEEATLHLFLIKTSTFLYYIYCMDHIYY